MRVKQEFKSPKFKNIRWVMDKYHSIKNRLTCKLNSRKNDSHSVVAIYDLNSNPITYDFAYFLLGAELYAKSIGEDSFYLCVIQDSNSCVSEQDDYRKFVSTDSQYWRIKNIILDLVPYFNSCTGFQYRDIKQSLPLISESKNIYPPNYNGKYAPGMNYSEIFKYIKKYDFTGFRAPQQGLNYIEKWKFSKNISHNFVTITLRQYGWDPLRNSNIGEWVKFAHYIKNMGFTPVFIPDTDAAFDTNTEFSEFISFNEACWNVGLRVSIYECAYLNFFGSNGTAALAMLNKLSSCILMKTVVPNSLVASKSTFDERGIKVGDENYCLSDRQHVLSWNDDQFNFILEEFNAFIVNNPVNKKNYSI